MSTKAENFLDTESAGVSSRLPLPFVFNRFRRMSSAIFDDQGNRVIDSSVTWPPHSFSMSQSGQSQSASGSQSLSGSTSDNPSPPSDQFQSGSSASSTSGAPVPTYGAPFRVEWIRTMPLPFSQVTHLKNPWNGNVSSHHPTSSSR